MRVSRPPAVRDAIVHPIPNGQHHRDSIAFGQRETPYHTPVRLLSWGKHIARSDTLFDFHFNVLACLDIEEIDHAGSRSGTLTGAGAGVSLGITMRRFSGSPISAIRASSTLDFPWRVGAEEAGAAKDGFGRRDAARPARAA
jgi:hypothetical protein